MPDFLEYDPPEQYHAITPPGGSNGDAALHAAEVLQPGTGVRPTAASRSRATLSLLCRDRHEHSVLSFITVSHLYSRQPLDGLAYRLTNSGALEPFGYLWRRVPGLDGAAIRVHPLYRGVCSPVPVSLPGPPAPVRPINAHHNAQLVGLGGRMTHGLLLPPHFDGEHRIDPAPGAPLPAGGDSGGLWLDPGDRTPLGMQLGQTADGLASRYSLYTDLLPALGLVQA